MDKVYNFPNNNDVTENNNNFNFEDFFSALEEAGTGQGMEEIALLLELSDDKFAIIAPIYLMEMEKTLNTVDDKLALTSALHVAGNSLAEVKEMYEKLSLEIDGHFKDILSIQKRNFLKRMCAIVVNAINDVEGTSKKILQIPLEKIHENAKIPAYANPGDAGMDVFALEDITINPGETKLIPLGIKVAVPFGYELQVRPKSGRALKTKLRVANTPGTIDSGYRDEICVIIENIEPAIKDITYTFDNDGKPQITSILHGSSFTIGKGEKFAQLVLCEVPTASFFEVDSVRNYEGDRGGGFGSSGLQ